MSASRSCPRIAVVGAGLIGLTIAWACRTAGAQVVLLDPAPAQGATRAAAGMLAAVAETYHEEHELSELLVSAAQAYPGFLAQVEHVTQRWPGRREVPTLVVGADAADREFLTGLHDLGVRLGLASERLTTQQARQAEPLLSRNISGVFRIQDDHQVDPRELSAVLLAGLMEAGLTFVAEAVQEVTHRDPNDTSSPATGVRVGGRHVPADAVVLANALGATSIGGLPWSLGEVLRPVHGDIIRLGPPPAGSTTLQHTVRALVNGLPHYLVPRRDGSLVLGATSREDGLDGVSAGGVYELLRDAIWLVPSVRERDIIETMARPRPATADNRPLLGELAPGLILATGFGRNGILLSPVAAMAVTAMLGLDAPGWGTLPDLTCVDPRRFRPSMANLQETR